MTAPMTLDQVVAYVESLGGVLTLRPAEGDGSPEAAWGDAFCYYAPDGVVPSGQPFATVVTKDQPGEPAAGLDRPDAIRVNVGASREEFRRWAGREPREPASEATAAQVGPDTIAPHPTYGALGWLAVVDPGEHTTADLHDLLRSAHARARARWDRRETT